MKNETTLEARLSDIEGTGFPLQSKERVESILDFDASGLITCQATKPLANGLGRIRDSHSIRSITMEEWSEISGK